MVINSSTVSAETMAHLGWDSLTIDLQHGLVDYSDASQCCKQFLQQTQLRLQELIGMNQVNNENLMLEVME